MKKIFVILVALFIMFLLSSCETYTYATTQDDIYVETTNDIVQSTVDFNIVVTHGIPYYYNGSLLYYLYNGLYYYPFYYDNYWYVRVYRRPFNHLRWRPYFRPHRYDHRFDRGYRPHHNWYRPHPNHHKPHGNRPDVRPNGSRPGVRPNTGGRIMRGSTQSRINSGGRSFGGSRGRTFGSSRGRR